MKRSKKSIALESCIWLATALYQALTIYIDFWHEFIPCFNTSLVFTGLWVLLSIAVRRLVSAVPFQSVKPWQFVFLHVVAGTVFSETWMFFSAVIFSFLWGIQTAVEIIPIAWFRFTTGLSVYILLVTIFALQNYHHQLRENEMQKASLEVLVLQMRMKAFRVQLNPHFIFNTLNTVNSLLMSAPRKAQKALLQLSDMLRYLLKNLDADVVTLNSELAFLRKYFELEKIRFGKRIEFRETVERSLGNVLIPSMILQPLVENAVVHGLQNGRRPGFVHLIACRENRQLKIQIIDNGIGNASIGKFSDAHYGVALDVLNRRLRDLYGESSRVLLEDGKPNGTVALLYVPELRTANVRD
jgi:two-component system LytT family sensor kinase